MSVLYAAVCRNRCMEVLDDKKTNITEKDAVAGQHEVEVMLVFRSKLIPWKI